MNDFCLQKNNFNYDDNSMNIDEFMVFKFDEENMNQEMEIDFDQIFIGKELFEDFDIIYDISIKYTRHDFINYFPKYIFFLDKIEIFRFFLDKKFSFYSINWISYNQTYLCSIINNPNFNLFLGFLYEKYKGELKFYSENDILIFITDLKYNFFNHMLNCDKFYQYILEDDLETNLQTNLETDSNIIEYYSLINIKLEEVD
jgi:hypothetical protein